jgi:NADPH-dependent 2,4-dienoyl-CoA reductase/sulfur reductase-like enzyme
MPRAPQAILAATLEASLARRSRTCDRGRHGGRGGSRRGGDGALARVLIVGGGERGASLASALLERGYAVRVVEVGAVPAGIERFDADPDRPGTLKAALEQVTVACWLFGSDQRERERERERLRMLNGARLERFLHQTIDSSVRGLVYEGAGNAGDEVLADGRRLVGEIAEQNAIPFVLLAREESESAEWLEEALEAVQGLVERYPAEIP